MAAPQIVPYDPAWPSVASAWIARLLAALTPRGIVPTRIEHIGSTAVPGLAAKPYLDLQLLFPAVPDEAAFSAVMSPLGLQRARGSRPDSPGVDVDIPRPGADPRHHEKLLYFRDVVESGSVHGVILHVRHQDSSFAEFVTVFRDWLWADVGARTEYERLKRGLAEEFAGASDYDDYTRAKSAFMDRAQAAMGWPRALGRESRTRPSLEG